MRRPQHAVTKESPPHSLTRRATRKRVKSSHAESICRNIALRGLVMRESFVVFVILHSRSKDGIASRRTGPKEESIQEDGLPDHQGVYARLRRTIRAFTPVFDGPSGRLRPSSTGHQGVYARLQRAMPGNDDFVVSRTDSKPTLRSRCGRWLRRSASRSRGRGCCVRRAPPRSAGSSR